MNKAFIFDMDGVMVDSENAWEKYESNFYEKIFGKELNDKVGNTIGLTVNTAYDKAKALFTQNLVKGYKQIDADAKARNMEEVIEIVENFGA